MAVQNDTGFKAFLTAEAIVAYRCVRLDGDGSIVYADDEESPIGVSQQDADDATHCTVKLMNSPGTFKVTVDAAVTFAVTTDERGPLLYVNDDGKVNPAGTKVMFNALEAASGAGSIIEATPYNIPN